MNQEIFECFVILGRRNFFSFPESPEMVGTQGEWLRYCSRDIGVCIRYIYIRLTDWEERHNCWVKFLWVNISHSCSTIKVMSKFYNVTTKSKPRQSKSRTKEGIAPLLYASQWFRTKCRVPGSHNGGASTHGRENSWWLGYHGLIWAMGLAFICGRGGELRRHRPRAKSWAHGCPGIRIQTWGQPHTVNTMIYSVL